MAAKPMMPREHPFVKAVASALRWRCGVRAGGRIVVAVSGGGDSVALLRTLAALADRRTWKLNLAVGHVQHHLRDADHAEADAAFVAELAQTLDLPFLRADLSAPPDAGNLEAWARAARYEALAEMAAAFDAPFIATAHQADDQLETLLMRLFRGASVRGMRGIAWKRRMVSGSGARISGLEPRVDAVGDSSPETPDPKPESAPSWIIRPMLAVDRAAVRGFLDDIGQAWREDHTNADVSRLRARLRAEVTPLLRSIQPDVPRRAVAMADHLRQVARLLDASIASAADRVLVSQGRSTLDRVDARLLPPVVLSGLLRRLLTEAGIGHDRLGARVLVPIVRAIRDTKGGRRPFALGGGVEVVVTRDTVAVIRV